MKLGLDKAALTCLRDFTSEYTGSPPSIDQIASDLEKRNSDRGWRSGLAQGIIDREEFVSVIMNYVHHRYADSLSADKPVESVSESFRERLAEIIFDGRDT